MKTWVRKSLKVGVLSAGIILFAGGSAQAAEWNTSDNDGALTGNQILADVDVPVNVCGTAVGALGGDAAAACAIPMTRTGGASGVEAMETSDSGGLLSGNQAVVPVDVPILICGNAVGALGDAAAACGAEKDDDSGYGDQARRMENWSTSDSDGLLTGNQILADVDVPILACGNAIGVVGDAAAACKPMGHGGGGSQSIGSWETEDNDGLLNGNQILADVDVPILACGNAISVLGDSAAGCAGGHGGDNGDDDGDNGDDDGDNGDDDGDNGDDDGDDDGDNGDDDGDNGDDDGDDDGDNGDNGYGESARSGAVEALPVFDSIKGLRLTDVLPLGQSTAKHAAVERGGASGWSTSDSDGLLTGNQILADVDIPVDVHHNAVAVAGDAITR